MAQTLEGRRVLVTGATGLFGLPLARHLARSNEVWATARFSHERARDALDAAGVVTVRWDLTDPDLSPLPDGIDLVFHAGAWMPVHGSDQRAAFESNTQASGRLMYRYRDCAGFLYCSSASAYAPQDGRDLREDDPLGMGVAATGGAGMLDYVLSKIAAEQLVEFLSRQLAIPAVVLRIFGLYAPGGGAPHQWISRLRDGKPVPLHPQRPNRVGLIYEDDFVEKAIAAIQLAAVPPLVVNLAGSDEASVELVAALAGEALGGVEVTFVESERMFLPTPADVTRMEALLGPTKVPLAEGVRRIVEAMV